MEKKTERLRVKAALAAFQALIICWKGSTPPFKEIAALAWQASEKFIKAREKDNADQYDRVLTEHSHLDALRRILELDGNTGRCLDFVLSLYADKPDPLRSYSDDDFGAGKTTGQIAIKCFKLEEARKNYNARLAADAFTNARPTNKETPLRLTPENRKFLLDILEENSPEKTYEEMYRKTGEPLPEWLVEKIAEAKKKNHTPTLSAQG